VIDVCGENAADLDDIISLGYLYICCRWTVFTLFNTVFISVIYYQDFS